MSDIVAELRTFTVDYDLTRMSDEEEPMPGVRVKHLREAADEIVRLREQVGDLGDRLNLLQGQQVAVQGEGAWEDEPPAWARDPFNGEAGTKCGKCGAWEEIVRPGKTQCRVCG